MKLFIVTLFMYTVPEKMSVWDLCVCVQISILNLWYFDSPCISVIIGETITQAWTIVLDRHSVVWAHMHTVGW